MVIKFIKMDKYLSKMNIEKKEDSIFINYVYSNYNTFRCEIWIKYLFVVNFCKRNLEKMEILQNYILEG